MKTTTIAALIGTGIGFVSLALFGNKKPVTYEMAGQDAWIKDQRSINRRIKDWFVFVAGWESPLSNDRLLKNPDGTKRSPLPLVFSGKRVVVTTTGFQVRIKGQGWFVIDIKEGRVFKSRTGLIEHAWHVYCGPPDFLLEAFVKLEKEQGAAQKEVEKKQKEVKQAVEEAGTELAGLSEEDLKKFTA